MSRQNTGSGEEQTGICICCKRRSKLKKIGQLYGPKCARKVAGQPHTPTIATTKQSKKGAFVGWKVYLDGEKYPKKPVDMYGTTAERAAVRLAFMEAGLDPNMTDDIRFEG